MTLAAIDEIHLTGNIRSANDNTTGVGLTVDNGETITAVVETYDTPTYITPTNCSITLNTVGDDANSNTPTVTTMVVSFGSSTAGNFSTYIYQSSGAKLFQISGYFSGNNSSEPAGEMTMSGDNPLTSVNIEIGGAAGKQIQLNDYGCRILANGTSIPSAPVSLDDMYGKTYTPTYPHGAHNSANDTFTDTDIPAAGVVGSTSSNTQISGTEYWRRVTLTYTGTSGTKYLHLSAQLDGTGGGASYFRGDAQFASYAINETLYPFEKDDGTFQPGWKSYNAVPPTATNPDEWNESAATTITALNQNANHGRFVIRSTNSPTGSQGTGRLYNIAQGFPNNNNTSRGFGYWETSSSLTTYRTSNQYYHAKSPGYVLNTGDTIDVYYGVDCASLAYIKFAII